MITTSNETSQKSMFSDNGVAAYVFHETRLKNNIESMRSAFKKLYRNFQIAYSFKTNYLKRICEIASESGCMAEVVSPFEREYATMTGGFSENDIVYNGVIPDVEGKFSVAANGGIVNIDNITEYEMLSEIAFRNRKVIGVGIRTNFDIGNGVVSRFGVDINGSEFSELIRRIANDDFVFLKGFHCHIGAARPTKYWKEKTRILADLAKRHSVEYIDLGGGMFGPMKSDLSIQFDGYARYYDDYAEYVCPTMKEAFPDESVRLIVEPGTALVGNTMDFVAHVTNIKNVRGRTFITLDTCSNHLGIICECKDLPMRVIENQSDRMNVCDACIAGCTCLEFDYIKKSFSGSISVGDTVVFPNVGAYSIGSSNQFIVPRPPVVCYETGEVLREGESTNDMFHKYL